MGSALPAFLVIAALHGRAGVRDLARWSLRWRVGMRWYGLALLGVPIATLPAATALLGVAPLNALADKWPLLFTVVLPQRPVACRCISNLALQRVRGTSGT